MRGLPFSVDFHSFYGTFCVYPFLWKGVCIIKRLAIIMGATCGIGYELAKIMVYEDVDILAVSHNQEKLDALCEELQSLSTNKVYSLAADLSD